MKMMFACDAGYDFGQRELGRDWSWFDGEDERGREEENSGRRRCVVCIRYERGGVRMMERQDWWKGRRPE
jgi:hypothetical protein